MLKVDQRVQPAFLSANLRLILRSANGQIENERIVMYWRKWEGFKSESVLLKFTKPNDVKNTAFLTTTENGKTRHTIYLPGLGEPKLLKQTHLNSSFMNSDFNYGDLRSWELSKNTNRLIDVNSDYYIIESVFKTTFYNQRMLLRVQRESYFIEEVSYFRKGCKLPTRILTVIGADADDETSLLVPSRLLMSSYKDCTGELRSSSEILFENCNVSSDIDEDIFSLHHMTSGKFSDLN